MLECFITAYALYKHYRMLRRNDRLMKLTECFKIAILEVGENIFDIFNAKTVHEVKCDRNLLKVDPITIVADPFLFVHNNCLYLFYEKKTFFQHGVLVMEKTDDLVNWSSPKVVLSEPFHLSFPFVFDDNGKVYMIPETSAAGEVRLYEASDDNLNNFVFKKKLLVDENIKGKKISYSDSIVYIKDGTYFLWTSFCDNQGVNIEELYYSDSLFGSYKKHSKSPISVSKKYGRNAGSIIRYGGHTYRPAQDCVDRYGDNVHVLRIINLSRYEYSETPFREDIIIRKIPYYMEGGHHINFVEFNGKRIIATDAKEYNKFIFARILRKIRWFI